MTFLRSVIVVVNLLGPFVASELTEVVQTSTGPVQGVILKTYDSTKYSAFKGIPYAEPPVGNLRFKRPVPIKPWKGVLKATVEGEKCPQYSQQSTVIGAEDCLFLNVFTPAIKLSATSPPELSVMVWFHDGNFADGSGSIYMRHPDFLIFRSIVLVTLNYRLGALGFLRLDHPDATGNQGLKDQNLALKWVRTNIRKFGGNPKSVTIIGKSAGAASVGFHVLSYASTGLFHRAISMSGTPLAPWAFVSRVEAVRRGRKLAKLVGKNPIKVLGNTNLLMRILRQATPERLLQKTLQIDRIAAFVPTLEEWSTEIDVFLDKCSVHKYRDGDFNKVPQLLGVMEDETSPYVRDVRDLAAMIGKSITYMEKVVDDQEKLSFLQVALQLSDNPAMQDRDNVKSVVAATTNILFKTPVEQTLKFFMASKDETPIYYYDMSFRDDNSSDNAQTDSDPSDNAHSANDLDYLFYNPITNRGMSAEDPMGFTIQKICYMWTNFAKYGNPTPRFFPETRWNPEWPNLRTTEQALEIGKVTKIVEKPLTALATSMKLPYENHIDVFADC